jgi:hypothetical protein
MYSVDGDLLENNEISDSCKVFSLPCHNLKQSSLASSMGTTCSNDTLKSLADKFTTSFPMNDFSQASIQGYLLKYPKSPILAIERVCE